MITVSECARYAGLASNELLLGIALSEKHYTLLSQYLLDVTQSPSELRDAIVADLRDSVRFGWRQRAADLLVVLRLFLSDYPEAREICFSDYAL